ncbi:hypothetical protein HY635_00925 [Candidatus Uhrbacteria bacterium]|nr:hypothetical protein [Candidatus Uhrbacteria bacterium]
MARKKDDGETATGAGNGTNGGNGGGASGTAELVAARALLIGTTPIRIDPMDEEKILRITGKLDEEKPPTKCKLDELRAWLTERARKNLDAACRADGRYGLPPRYLREALISAGTGVKTGRMSKLSTATKSQVPSLIKIADTFLSFPRNCQTWALDIDHGHGQTGDFAAIFRARFDRWAIRPTLVFDPHRIAEATVRELVKLAGQNVGLGGHRPDRKGDGGMFEIGGWELLKEVPVLTGAVDVATLAAELKDEAEWTAPAAG